MSQDVKDPIQYVESGSLTPDKYLTPRATEVMVRLPGEKITSELFPQLLAELDGFKDDQEMIRNACGHAEHFFAPDVDFGNTTCESVSYDPGGLIGLKFDNPRLQAIVIQPDDDGDGKCRLQVVADGMRHEYKMQGGTLVSGFNEKIAEESRTYQMLAHLGVDVAKMNDK
ncbi:MAG: hypothetical protein WC851_01360 [Candidatus Shapirobacteria bacterium]|jgi:hypothetical protein